MNHSDEERLEDILDRIDDGAIDFDELSLLSLSMILNKAYEEVDDPELQKRAINLVFKRLAKDVGPHEYTDLELDYVQLMNGLLEAWSGTGEEFHNFLCTEQNCGLTYEEADTLVALMNKVVNNVTKDDVKHSDEQNGYSLIGRK